MDEEKLKEERKNRDFVQVYRDHIDDIADLAMENAMAYKLLMFMLKHMDGKNALCVSNIALQEIFECSRPTISRAVKYLKENGWICVLKSGTTNVYIVNPEVAWTSYGNQKQYCKFEANVIMSSTENAEYLNNPKAFNKFKTIDESFIRSVQENNQKFREETERILGNCKVDVTTGEILEEIKEAE